MADQELFVVCKSCSAEVSPYVTECPYCGQRVRKRAPKLGPGGAPARLRRLRLRGPRLARLRGDEIPGIAPETRPNATIALIAASLGATVVARTTLVAPTLDGSLHELGGIYFAVAGGEWWRYLAAPLLFDNMGYQVVALVATGIFGMHLERRFGWWAVAAIFLAAGAGGAFLSDAAGLYPVLGANGAALGLLCAWLVDDRRAAVRGFERGNDLIGVYAIAAVLVLLSAATESASIVAAAGGATIGTLAGLALGVTRR